VNPRSFQPLIEEFPSPPEPAEALRRWSSLPHCVFLDSAQSDPRLGRYSFLAADPFDFLDEKGTDEKGTSLISLGPLAGRLARLHTPAIAGLPPFQGGAAGLFAYELGRRFETLPRTRFDEFALPALAVGLYDVVLAYDHAAARAWLISQGLPEQEPSRRRRRAAERLAEFRRLLTGTGPTEPRPHAEACLAVLSAEELAPQFPCVQPGLTSTFSRSGYLAAVRRVIDYIVAGDVFQVNLSQRLVHPAHCDAVELYMRLRRCNPAPFAGYFDLGPFQIVSASPERFLRVSEGQVETRPIKGTRPRTGQAADDRQAAAELEASDKDRAENVMIVDLLRNDLSRVCRPESVRVSQLCEVETYRHVVHLVSAVRGTLGEGRGPLDLVQAAFPGGSVTGAPKVRAMEIIAELEPAARGAYCGSLGYLGLDGSADLSILIRTITAGRGWWQAPVGGGVVAQSDPEQEYQETWDKAEGLIQAMLP